MGDGARGNLAGYAPGCQEWMRLEAAPVIQQDAFSDAAWHKQHRGVPFFAWPLLAASVLAVSSAGAAFEQLNDVPPITLAAWRLQLTSVILLCGAAWQWKTSLNAEQRRQVLDSWKMLAGSGICLAFHFGCWVWSLQHTSLAHSLLFVCSVPVVIVVGMIVLRKPISRGEVLGCAAGFCGALLLALGPRGVHDARVTLAGDMAALVAAMVFIGYLAAGRTLRQWMPIFVYAFPVTGVGAVLLSLAAVAMDGAGPLRGGSQGVAGWLAGGRHAAWVVYLSFVPGIVGHTGFNTLLRYLTPLTVSLAFQLEPLVGTLIGWAAGAVREAPGWSTWVGGLVVLAATCVVTAATAKREARQEAKGRAAVELEQVFASEQQGLLDKEAEEEQEDDSPQHAGPHQGERSPLMANQETSNGPAGASPGRAADGLPTRHAPHVHHAPDLTDG